MRTLPMLAFAGLLTVGLVAAPGAADAKRLALWNTGEDVFEVGDLPQSLAQGQETEGWKAGYKCSIFGLFWAYMHWWDCEPVVFKGDTYNNSPEVAKAVSEQYSQSDMKMGVWQGYGRWAFVLLVVLAIAGMIVSRGEDDEEEEQQA